MEADRLREKERGKERENRYTKRQMDRVGEDEVMGK